MKVKKSKKAIAIDVLLGTVLSVIALFFILQIIFSFLLHTPTNEKIAIDNAKSIVEFVDYSYNKYNNKDGCYTMLKLKHLENFQIENNNQIYFYIISEKGVGIYRKEHFFAIMQDPTSINNYEKFYEFKHIKEVSIKQEDISIWNKVNKWADKISFQKIINNLFSFNSNENLDSFYTIDLKNSEMVVLMPIFGKEFLGIPLSFGVDLGITKIEINADNQNILSALNFERTKDVSWFTSLTAYIQDELFYGSYYLVFKSPNIIFPSYTIDGENYIKQNLCEIELYKETIFRKRFETLDDYLNYINKENVIIINSKNIVDNSKMSWKFMLYDNKINCRDGWNGEFSNNNLGKARINFNFKTSFNQEFTFFYDKYGDIIEVYDENGNQIFNPFLRGDYFESYKNYFGDIEGISNIYIMSDNLINKKRGMFSFDDTNIIFDSTKCFGEFKTIFRNFDTCGGVINKHSHKDIIDVFKDRLIEKKDALICKNILPKLSENEDFEKLLEEIEGVFEQNNVLIETNIVVGEKTTQSYLKNLLKEIEIKGNDNIKSWNNDNYIIYQLDSFISWGSNRLNDCNKNICKYALYNKLNGDIYFYDGSILNNFVMFDYTLLEKEVQRTEQNPYSNIYKEMDLIKSEIILYFNREEINFDIIEITEQRTFRHNILPTSPNSNYFFILDIPVNDGSKYQVLLTQSQWNKINLKVNY